MGRFGASHRVRRRSEFRRIQAGGAKVVSPSFVFLMQVSSPGRPPRLGVTASRRVGNAVRRNRCKRLLREAFRAFRDSWPDGVDVVVIVRRPIHQLALSEVAAEWEGVRPRLSRAFRRLGLDAGDAVGRAGSAPTRRDGDSC